MRVSLLAVSALAAAAFATAPAYADIVMVDASSIQGSNVLFNDEPQIGTTVNGFTNTTPSLSLDFSAGGDVLRSNGGQARVEGDGANLTEFFFELTDGGTFNDVEFRLFGGRATTASFTLVDDSGTEFTFLDQTIDPSGFFGFQGINGQSIASVSFTLNGDGIRDVRQIRLSPVGTAGNPDAIPEPATWAMLLGGFGMLGAAARRRTRTVVTYA